MGANESKIILGQKPDGSFVAIKVDENGNLVTTGSVGGTSAVQISNGSTTATITDVSGKKSLDVNVTDITLNKDNDSVTSHQAELKTLIDEVSETVTYIGKAVPGANTSSASWLIKRITESGTITTVAYADGNSSFDNVWDNRTSLTYS